MATIALATAGAVAVAPGAAEGPAATAAATKKVKVADDAYSPKRLKVPKGTRIKWVWSSRNTRRHDVYMDRRPKGAQRFNSPPAISSFRFARKLRKPGRYTFLCTFHEGMRMRIDVSR